MLPKISKLFYCHRVSPQLQKCSDFHFTKSGKKVNVLHILRVLFFQLGQRDLSLCKSKYSYDVFLKIVLSKLISSINVLFPEFCVKSTGIVELHCIDISLLFEAKQIDLTEKKNYKCFLFFWYFDKAINIYIFRKLVSTNFYLLPAICFSFFFFFLSTNK